MSEFQSLKNHFLIAMPKLEDPHFVQSITLICEHNDNGAMGIVINHPLSVSTQELFEYLDIELKSNQFHNHPVMAGGPVQTDRGFVIHRSEQEWESSLSLNDEISVTTSQDILLAIAENEGPQDAFVALGYAGWDEGQLEEELKENIWLSVPIQSRILFDTKIEKRWQQTLELLGIQASQLSSFSGNA